MEHAFQFSTRGRVVNGNIDVGGEGEGEGGDQRAPLQKTKTRQGLYI